MGVLIGFAWFLATIYALVSLFRILPPFRKRSQAGLALGGIQIVAIAAAAAVGVGADQPPAVAKPDAREPQKEAVTSNTEGPPYVVRVKPGEKLETPVAAPKDVAAGRVPPRGVTAAA